LFFEAPMFPSALLTLVALASGADDVKTAEAPPAVTVAGLADAWDKDESAFREMYEGKRVRLTGVPSGYADSDRQDRPEVLTLRVTKADRGAGNKRPFVNCHIHVRHKARTEKLAGADEATVVGTVRVVRRAPEQGERFIPPPILTLQDAEPVD
jgi:hypothetical protein